jgi:hypothetical protein
LARCAPVSNKTATGTADKCTKNVLGTLYSGIFTFGTDQPVYPPWYMGDNPASGEGFEAAAAYAVAAKMNYAKPRRAMGTGALSTPHWLLGQRRSTPTCLSSRSPTSARPRWISRRRIST